MSKPILNPQDLLKDFERVLNIIEKIDKTDNLDKIDTDKIAIEASKLEKDIKTKYKDFLSEEDLDIKK